MFTTQINGNIILYKRTSVDYILYSQSPVSWGSLAIIIKPTSTPF